MEYKEIKNMEYYEALKLAKNENKIVKPVGWKYGIKHITLNDNTRVYVYGDKNTILQDKGQPKIVKLCDKVTEVTNWEIVD